MRGAAISPADEKVPSRPSETIGTIEPSRRQPIPMPPSNRITTRRRRRPARPSRMRSPCRRRDEVGRGRRGERKSAALGSRSARSADRAEEGEREARTRRPGRSARRLRSRPPGESTGRPGPWPALTLPLHDAHCAAHASCRYCRRDPETLILLPCSRSPPGRRGSQRSAGEGTLSVEDGRGKVTIQARGGVIGRLASGHGHDLRPHARGRQRPRRLRRRRRSGSSARRDPVRRHRHALPRHRRPLPDRRPGSRDRPLGRRQGLGPILSDDEASSTRACTRSTAPTAAGPRTQLQAAARRSRSASCSARNRREERGTPHDD